MSEPQQQKICFQDISVCYNKTCALHRLSWKVKVGDIVAIVGPNGAGKSTLLKSMMGFVDLHHGGIIYPHNTQPLIAYMPQKSHLDQNFPIKVRDVVTMGLYPRQGLFQKLHDDTQQKVDEALARVGLKGRGDASLDALSGGQFQRMLFARLWLQDADLILLDEPFAGIDTHTTQDLMQIIAEWRKSGKTVLAVLHDYDLVREFFPYCLLLARKYIAFGSTPSVLTIENLNKARDLAYQWEEGSVHV